MSRREVVVQWVAGGREGWQGQVWGRELEEHGGESRVRYGGESLKNMGEKARSTSRDTSLRGTWSRPRFGRKTHCPEPPGAGPGCPVACVAVRLLPPPNPVLHPQVLTPRHSLMGHPPAEPHLHPSLGRKATGSCNQTISRAAAQQPGTHVPGAGSGVRPETCSTLASHWPLTPERSQTSPVSSCLAAPHRPASPADRKSTRLNSSH